MQQYSGVTRERDIPTSTHEYLSKQHVNKLEICEWIKEHFDEINEGQGPDEIATRTVRREADLNAAMKKEEPNLDEVGLVDDIWRSY